MSKHEDFMDLAYQQAKLAYDKEEVPIGAVVVINDKVIASAHNQTIGLSDPTAHAEILALRLAAKQVNNYRLVGASLYTTLEPCCMCAGAIVHARIAQLLIGASDPKAGACGSVFDLTKGAPLNHKVKLSLGIMETACSALLKDFFKQRRR